MTHQLKASAATIQLKVQDFATATAWYERLIGRPADLAPNDSIHEWEVFPGGWIQVTAGSRVEDPGRVRFGVADVERERSRAVDELGIEVSEVTVVPGLVAYCNVDDPWGNRLGLFQDLAT